MDREPPVVVFDGECNFCDAAVNFIIDHDPHAVFRFVAHQAPAGKRLLESHGLPPSGVDSMILIEDGRVYLRSTASLRIARRLSGGWRLLSLFAAVPAPLRDGVYKIVSRQRKRLMGQRDTCVIPTPELRARFLAD